MPSISFNITQSDTLLSTNVSANTQLTMSVTNPISYPSYFSLETIPNNDGFYTIDTPKNLSGSFILDSNTTGLVKDDYKMSAIIEPGVTNIVYTPAVDITGSTLRVRGVSGINTVSEFDPDYQAVLNYALSQPIPFVLPSAGQQILQNQLILDLKAGGIWNKLDVFAIFATDGSSDFALIDWKRLSLMDDVNSPTFTTNQGFTGDGASSYIDTNFNPATQGVNYTLNDASRYFMGLLGGADVYDGVTVGSLTNTIRASSTSQQIINGGTLSASFNYGTGRGIRSIHRTSATDVTLYNSKTSSTRTSTSTSVASQTQLILRRGTIYGTATSFGYAMGASLITENDSFVDALNNYIDSI